MRPEMLIFGRGAFATAMHDYCESHDIRLLKHGVHDLHNNPTAVALFAGSSESWPSFLSNMQEKGLPTILASTDIEVEADKAEDAPVIKAPNLCLEIIEALKTIRNLDRRYDGSGLNFTVLESHQQRKKGVSGTAKKLMKQLGRAPETIDFERSPAVQRQLGIPEEHIDGHAYHFFTWSKPGLAIEINIKVNGRASYGSGMIALAEKVLERRARHELQNGVYDFEDIIMA